MKFKQKVSETCRFGTIKLIPVVLGLSFSGLVACSSDKDSINEVEKTRGETYLKVKIKGIEDIVEVANASIKASTGVHSASSSITGEEKMVYGNSLDALISFKELPKIDVRKKQASIDKGALATKAASTPMEGNRKYRLLIYDESGSNLLQNIEATAGSDPSIDVDGEKTYKWVAVSTNETAVPNVNNGKVAADDITNKDVLYATGTISAKKGENYLEIVLQHKTSRFDVDIDTRGLFGDVNTFSYIQLGTGTGNQFSSIIKTADLNVLSGNFEGLKNVANNKTAVNVVNKDVSTGTYVKTVSIYSVIPAGTNIAQNTLILKPSFTTNLDHVVAYPPSTDDVYTRQYGTSNTYLNITNSSLAPVEGDQFKIGVRMVESAIRVGGISWARADIWYDANNTLDKYRFRSDSGHEPYMTAQKSEYWLWNMTTPDGQGGAAGDPCMLVYPANTWRTPSAQEFTALFNRSSAEYRGFSNNTPDTYNWYGVINQYWTVDNGSPESAGVYGAYSDRLLLTFNGDIANGQIRDSRIQVDARKSGNYRVSVAMRYWTSTDGTNGNAQGANQTASVQVNGPYNINATYASDKTVGSNYSKQTRRNIRCVRN